MDVSAFPERIPAPRPPGRSGDQGAFTYLLDPDRVALRGPLPSSVAPGAAVRLGPDLTVVPATGTPEASAAVLLPVYSLGAGGAPFVPTGSLGLRFREGISARERQGSLHDLGYRILAVPAYAPHFTWIEAESGRLVDTLAGLDELQRLPDVAHLEVQMVTPKAMR